MPPQEKTDEDYGGEIEDAAGIDEGNAPIGVSPGYNARRERDYQYQPEYRPAGGDVRLPRPGQTRTGRVGYDVPPTFFEDDIEDAFHMSAEEIARLQRQLVAAGLLSEDYTQFGRWRNDSIGAYADLLAYANQSGYTSVDEAMEAWMALEAKFPSKRGGSGRAGLPIRLSSPDDLRPIFRKAVIDTLGRGYSATDIDNMIDAYQHIEANFQRGVQGISDSGGDSTITEPPSAQAFAESYAREKDPTKAQGHDFLGAANQFFDSLGAWDGA